MLSKSKILEHTLWQLHSATRSIICCTSEWKLFLRIFSIQTTNSTIIEWSLIFDEKTESLQLDYADGVYYCSTHNDGGSYAFFYDTPNFPT